VKRVGAHRVYDGDGHGNCQVILAKTEQRQLRENAAGVFMLEPAHVWRKRRNAYLSVRRNLASGAPTILFARGKNAPNGKRFNPQVG